MLSSAQCSRGMCLCSTGGRPRRLSETVLLALSPGFKKIPAPFAIVYVQVAAPLLVPVLVLELGKSSPYSQLLGIEMLCLPWCLNPGLLSPI